VPQFSRRNFVRLILVGASKMILTDLAAWLNRVVQVDIFQRRQLLTDKIAQLVVRPRPIPRIIVLLQHFGFSFLFNIFPSSSMTITYKLKFVNDNFGLA
jgi:hypothetical protein